MGHLALERWSEPYRFILFIPLYIGSYLLRVSLSFRAAYSLESLLLSSLSDSNLHYKSNTQIEIANISQRDVPKLTKTFIANKIPF